MERETWSWWRGMKRLKRGDLVRISPHERQLDGVRAIVCYVPGGIDEGDLIDDDPVQVYYLEGFLAGQKHYRAARYIWPVE